MNIADTVWEKVFHLPPKAQEEVLKQVEQIEERYHNEEPLKSNGANSLKSLFGSVSLGYATGANNESIDADLALEYSSKHEDEN